MSEQTVTDADTSIPAELFVDTRQPFELSEELQQRVDQLELNSTVEQLKENGYGYVYQPSTNEFNERLRETIIRIGKPDPAIPGGGGNMLLDKDPIFEDVVINPKLLTIVEIMCGKGAMLSQLAASIKPKGPFNLGLHADQNWFPAPFPVHNQLVTFCWATDEFSEEAGSTKVIPKSNGFRRHPNAEETQKELGAIATQCPAGSIVVWDGSTWHGSYPRQIDGERVVLHITYSRLALRPVESYDYLDDAWLEGKPFEMSVLLGREDFLNTPQGGFAHGEKLPRTFVWAKT